MNLKTLHEQFIEVSRRPMQFGRFPVSPKEVEIPVVPMNRWKVHTDPRRLSKTYDFRRKTDKSAFVVELLSYEEKTQHNADIFITEDSVRVELRTRDLDQITDIDKDYAKYCDELYKELTIIYREEGRGDFRRS